VLARLARMGLEYHDGAITTTYQESITTEEF
jgi:hypothetical protein